MNWSLLPYGAYVAFAFACILFGGLAYRQVIDMLELRATKTGEDLDLYFSAPGVVYAVLAALALVPIGWLCYGVGEPTIWKYALPLVGMVQLVQLAGRLYFQRLRLRTRAIVVRFVLRSESTIIQHAEIENVHVCRNLLWSTITITGAHNKVASFRIFRFSEDRLLDRIRSLSGVRATVDAA